MQASDSILENLLSELEALGSRNDAVQTQKDKRYLNITRDTGEFLALLVKAVGATTALEIGTSNGYSTLWLASAVPDEGQVHTIEHQEAKAREARDNIERAGMASRVTQLVGDVRQALSAVPETVDVIFLDADRSLYLPLADRLFARLKAGGLLVCDNAISHEREIRDFVAWIEANEALTMSLVPVGKGELLVYKEAE
ncbi:O-methyltransferase [Halomonas faecis]|uniref:O-methyltransferase n=1 Tax=Halomonas faecis TaxID=1562110 RepID=UPI0013D02C86|nr:O-methyltransferase [Halomonas faecis]